MWLPLLIPPALRHRPAKSQKSHERNKHHLFGGAPQIWHKLHNHTQRHTKARPQRTNQWFLLGEGAPEPPLPRGRQGKGERQQGAAPSPLRVCKKRSPARERSPAPSARFCFPATQKQHFHFLAFPVALQTRLCAPQHWDAALLHEGQNARRAASEGRILFALR